MTSFYEHSGHATDSLPGYTRYLLRGPSSPLSQGPAATLSIEQAEDKLLPQQACHRRVDALDRQSAAAYEFHDELDRRGPPGLRWLHVMHEGRSPGITIDS